MLALHLKPLHFELQPSCPCTNGGEDSAPGLAPHLLSCRKAPVLNLWMAACFAAEPSWLLLGPKVLCFGTCFHSTFIEDHGAPQKLALVWQRACHTAVPQSIRGPSRSMLQSGRTQSQLAPSSGGCPRSPAPATHRFQCRPVRISSVPQFSTLSAATAAAKWGRTAPVVLYILQESRVVGASSA